MAEQKESTAMTDSGAGAFVSTGADSSVATPAVAATTSDAEKGAREAELRQQLQAAEAELAQLQQNKQRVDHHIHVLHEYNDIKDIVQSLMGKCAEMEGLTTKDMYERFGLDLDD